MCGCVAVETEVPWLVALMLIEAHEAVSPGCGEAFDAVVRDVADLLGEGE
jgi:hypothetical protein